MTLSSPSHLPLVVVGDVNDGHQESQDDQMKEEVGVLVLGVVTVLVANEVQPVRLWQPVLALIFVVRVGHVCGICVKPVLVVAIVLSVVQVNGRYLAVVGGGQQVRVGVLHGGWDQHVGWFGVQIGRFSPLRLVLTWFMVWGQFRGGLVLSLMWFAVLVGDFCAPGVARMYFININDVCWRSRSVSFRSLGCSCHDSILSRGDRLCVIQHRRHLLRCGIC